MAGLSPIFYDRSLSHPYHYKAMAIANDMFGYLGTLSLVVGLSPNILFGGFLPLYEGQD